MNDMAYVMSRLYKEYESQQTDKPNNEFVDICCRILDILMEKNQIPQMFDVFSDSKTLYRYLAMLYDGYSPCEFMRKLSIRNKVLTPAFEEESRWDSYHIVNAMGAQASHIMNLSPDVQKQVFYDIKMNLKQLDRDKQHEPDIVAVTDTIEKVISPYITVFQGNATNEIVAIKTHDLSKCELDLTNDSAILKSDKCAITLRNFSKLFEKSGIPDFAWQFYFYLMDRYYENRKAIITITALEYREARSLKYNKDAMNQMENALKVWSNVGWCGIDTQMVFKMNKHGKLKPKKQDVTFNIEALIGSYEREKDEYKIFLDGKLITFWEGNFTANVHNEILKFNPKLNPNSIFLLFYIAINYRRNEGKQRLCTIPIKTIIQKSPNVIIKDEIAISHYKRRVVQRFFTDLDAISSVDYRVMLDDSEVTENRMNLKERDFMRAKLIIDYAQYPTHTEAVQLRDKSAKKSKNK